VKYLKHLIDSLHIEGQVWGHGEYGYVAVVDIGVPYGPSHDKKIMQQRVDEIKKEFYRLYGKS
jgi:hypothetical protein